MKFPRSQTDRGFLRFTSVGASTFVCCFHVRRNLSNTHKRSRSARQLCDQDNLRFVVRRNLRSALCSPRDFRREISIVEKYVFEIKFFYVLLINESKNVDDAVNRLFQFAPSVHPSSASICFVVINLRFDLDRPVNGDIVNYSILN